VAILERRRRLSMRHLLWTPNLRRNPASPVNSSVTAAPHRRGEQRGETRVLPIIRELDAPALRLFPRQQMGVFIPSNF